MCTILQQANKPITKKISTFLIVTSYNKPAAPYISLYIGDTVKCDSYGSRNYKL